MPNTSEAVLVAAKGIWVAIVVGVNVFLPTFTSAFGRYLVAYRLRPEGHGSEPCPQETGTAPQNGPQKGLPCFG